MCAPSEAEMMTPHVWVRGSTGSDARLKLTVRWLMVAEVVTEDPSLTWREAVRSCTSSTSSLVVKSMTWMVAREGWVGAEEGERMGVAMVREQSKDPVVNLARRKQRSNESGPSLSESLGRKVLSKW